MLVWPSFLSPGAAATNERGVRQAHAQRIPVPCLQGIFLIRWEDIGLWKARGFAMAAAVLTPRVRLMTVCDRVRESNVEAGVYHLRGVRQRIVARAFPFVALRLWLFFVLSSHRAGT